ncbi:MAG: PEP-CTERM sorting domain-containing protein [Chlorobium sp.]|nr:PEP-CTERM sorting domain-containing protein [Chlorobium sp.]
MKKTLLAGLAIGAFALSLTVASSVWASLYMATLADNVGPLDGGLLTYHFTSPGASANDKANLSFDLLGYLTVDGSNGYKDTFTLTVNGNILFSGGFNMGGGGQTFETSKASGVLYTTPGYGDNYIGGQGGSTHFSVAYTLLSGDNTFTFDYGVMQGLGDEGWGLMSISTRADITENSPVPEPATMLLFGTGIAGLASIARRKRS